MMNENEDAEAPFLEGIPPEKENPESDRESQRGLFSESPRPKNARIKIPRHSPMKQIRKNCLECVCGQRQEVRYCSGPSCALWYLRFGMSPSRFIKANGPESELLFDPENFKEGAIYDPDKDVRTFRSETNNKTK